MRAMKYSAVMLCKFTTNSLTKLCSPSSLKASLDSPLSCTLFNMVIQTVQSPYPSSYAEQLSEQYITVQWFCKAHTVFPPLHCLGVCVVQQGGVLEGR